MNTATRELQSAMDAIQQLNEASLRRTEKMLAHLRDLQARLDAWMEETQSDV